MRFGRIGILAGGLSSERKISLRSGAAVHKALSEKGFDAVLLDVKHDIRECVKNSNIDVAFIALHGRYGEDGTVQKMLEKSGIPYTGSGVVASKAALDKVISKKIFIKNNIPVPKYVVFEKRKFDIRKAERLGFPLVVKPHLEGSSIGLSIVRQKGRLKVAIDKAFKYGDKVIIEEYISGREFTVGILGGKPLPVIEIVTRNRVYDYKAKYKDSATQYLVPAPIDKSTHEEASRLGKAAHDALGCGSFSRVDMLMDDSGKMFVLEVNTIPGMTERSLLPKAAQACGLRFDELCVKILENALSKAGRE